jgi:hypothetical protein
VLPRLAFTCGAGLPVAGVGNTRSVLRTLPTLTCGMGPRSSRCALMSVVVLLPEDTATATRMLPPPFGEDS